jgi:ribosome-associated protein
VVNFVTDAQDSSRQKARLLAYATTNKKAINPTILDLTELSNFTDYFVIASGKTDVQVRAIYQELERVCAAEKLPVLHVEGADAGAWILLDLGDVVVHLFRHSEREFYDLEKLWHKAKMIPLPKL